jgi:hypothetical protein
VVADAEQRDRGAARHQRDVGASLPERPGDRATDQVRIHLPDGEGETEALVLEVVGDQPVPLVAADGVHRAVDGEEEYGGGAPDAFGDGDAGGAGHGGAPGGLGALHSAGDVHGRDAECLGYVGIGAEPVQKFDVEGVQHGVLGGGDVGQPGEVGCGVRAAGRGAHRMRRRLIGPPPRQRVLAKVW